MAAGRQSYGGNGNGIFSRPVGWHRGHLLVPARGRAFCSHVAYVAWHVYKAFRREVFYKRECEGWTESYAAILANISDPQ